MTRTCTICLGKLHGSNRSDTCLKCRRSRTCIDCDRPVSEVSGGRCVQHANALNNSIPERRQKAAATMRRKMADPVFRAEMAEASRAGTARAMQDPEFVERRREIGRRHGLRNIRHTWTPEVRARAGRNISAVKLAHVPADVRDMYRSLVNTGLSAAERLAIVLEHREVRERTAVADVRKRMGVSS